MNGSGGEATFKTPFFKKRVKLKRRLQRLGDVQLWKIYELLSQPWRFRMLRERPQKTDDINGLLFLFPHASRAEIIQQKMHFLKNHNFFKELNCKMIAIRYRRAYLLRWYTFLYGVIRQAKPEIMIETGIFDGDASAVVLQAMADNDHGLLISVDLPAYQMIPGATDRMAEQVLPKYQKPGWVIPDYLRSRHRLVLGDSRVELPALFEEYPKIDVFCHDSLHTYEHQYFEYDLAWNHLVDGGFLLSDDIYASKAYYQFAREKKRPYIHLDRTGFGALRK